MSPSDTPHSPIKHTAVDRGLMGLDRGLRGLLGVHQAHRPLPRPSTGAPSPELSATERQLSGALMRVNHVGEVCAQALYQSQALVTRDKQLANHFEAAAREEADHLAWTRERLDQLNDRISLLTPLWYAGAFGIGLAAGLAGDKASLGFVVETERQVEAHLAGHLDRLPEADHASRAIVAQMKQDEAEHAQQALEAGATELPSPVKGLMRLAAAVMTRVAHHI